MTISVRFYGFAYCFYSILRCPAALIRLALWGEPASPEGSFCSVSAGLRLSLTGIYPERPRNGTQAVHYGFAGGRYRSSTRVIYATLHGDESSPLHCVVPFICTGCIRNVAGGRLPPLRSRWWAVPFIRTGCNRHAPGMAHRPFSTVSPMGGFLNQRISKAGTFGAQ